MWRDGKTGDEPGKLNQRGDPQDSLDASSASTPVRPLMNTHIEREPVPVQVGPQIIAPHPARHIPHGDAFSLVVGRFRSGFPHPSTPYLFW